MTIAGGGQPTPQQAQAMDVKAAMMRPRGYVDPYTGEAVVEQPTDPRSRLGQMMGGADMQAPTATPPFIPPSAPAGAPPAGPVAPTLEPTLEDIPVGGTLMTPEQFDAAKAPQITGPLAGTKRGEFMEAQAGLKVEGAKILKDYDNQIATAGSELKEKKGLDKVASVLKRMKEINEKLKEKKAIVSGEASFGENVGRYVATTGLGQEVRKVTNPQTQALAEEYTKLQSTLLPYYASAAGLGAKSLDSEGERKSILGSFGDPSGIYESNKQQLKTLEGLFGVGNGNGAGPSKTGATSYKDYFR